MGDNEDDEPKLLSSYSRVRINTYIQRSLYDQAMEIAREEDKTMTSIVKEALKRYVRSYKSQIDEQER